MRKLIDLPGVAELERRAILDPVIGTELALKIPETGVAQLVRSLFGITSSEVEDRRRGCYWDDAQGAFLYFEDDEEDDDPEESEEAFEARMDEQDLAYEALERSDAERVTVLHSIGWDVNDEYGKPLRVLRHFASPMMAAHRGEFGAHDPSNRVVTVDEFEAQLRKEAQKFRPKR